MWRYLGVFLVVGLAGMGWGLDRVRAGSPFACEADWLVDRTTPRAIHCLAFSSSGTKLAVGLENGKILVWNMDQPPDRAASGSPLILPGRWGPIYSLAFSPQGDRLALVAGEDGVDVWSLEGREGKSLGTLGPYRGKVYSIAYSPDGALLATGGGVFVTLGEVRLWDAKAVPARTDAPTQAEQGSPLILPGHRQIVTTVAFSRDGRLMASAGGRFLLPGEVQLWDVQARKRRATLPSPSEKVTAVAFSPDGLTLAVGQRDGVISVWDVASVKRRCAWKCHYREVFYLAFSPGGQVLVSAGGDGIVQFWNPASGRRIGWLSDPDWQPIAGEPFSVALSPDGKLLATGTVWGRLQLWGVDLDALAPYVPPR